VHGAWRMALWRSADRRILGIRGVGALLGGGGGGIFRWASGAPGTARGAGRGYCFFRGPGELY
jgi:hypothetical protein